MENWALIININSGKRNFRKQIEYIYQELRSHHISFETRITRFPGHASLIARHLLSIGYTKFLVVGGDGTINEFINGVFSSSNSSTEQIEFGIIPRGTGNDWARYWGLTKDYKHSLNQFLNGRIQFIDIGKVEYHIEGCQNINYFINSIGFGLDANVANQTNIIKKYVGSHSFLYSLALLKVIFGFKPTLIEMNSKEIEFHDWMFTLNIANGCYSGGGMKQNPDAKPDDGLLDLMVVRKPSFQNIITALPLIFNGKILSHPAIESFKTKEVYLKSSQLIGIFETDGVVVNCASPLKVSIIPNAIQMIVPNHNKQ